MPPQRRNQVRAPEPGPDVPRNGQPPAPHSWYLYSLMKGDYTSAAILRGTGITRHELAEVKRWLCNTLSCTAILPTAESICYAYTLILETYPASAIKRRWNKARYRQVLAQWSSIEHIMDAFVQQIRQRMHTTIWIPETWVREVARAMTAGTAAELREKLGFRDMPRAEDNRNTWIFRQGGSEVESI